MKKIYVTLIFFGLLIVGQFSMCKILDVTKDITFTVDLVVNESDPDFDESELLDAVAESSEIEDYKDKIKSIEIVKIEYTIIQFNGPATQQINSATLEVADENNGRPKLIASVSDENLLALTTTTKELTINPTGADRLEELIKDSPHKALFHYYGNANTGPLSFTARFFITVKMTANPLN